MELHTIKQMTGKYYDFYKIFLSASTSLVKCGLTFIKLNSNLKFNL